VLPSPYILVDVIRIGVSLVCDRIGDLAGLVHAAETAGVDAIGVSDSPCLYPETYVQATIVARESSRVLFGPRVTNPVTRHPSVTASAMAAVDELSNGRAIIGIGVGDSAVHSIGERKATLAELREYVTALRDAFALGEATYKGKRFEFPQAKRPIPIYLAASGPRGLRLAGEVADGVIVGGGVQPELVQLSLEHVSAGAALAGRSVEDLEIWWLMGASIASSNAEAVEAIRPFLAAVANACFRGGLDNKGVPEELKPRLADLVTAYDFSEHALPGATRRNARLVSDYGLTEYLARRFAMTGTPEEFAEQVAAAASWGAKQLWFTMPLPGKHGFLDALGSHVIPRLRPAPA
jgi:5,10-methylenetetrahydromethanopterin reductase